MGSENQRITIGVMRIVGTDLIFIGCALLHIECGKFTDHWSPVDMPDNKINRLPQSLVIFQRCLEYHADLFLFRQTVYQVERGSPGKISKRVKLYSQFICSL